MAFKPYEHKDVNLMLPKLCYAGLNAGLFGMAVYKFSVMGVIPVTPHDWQGIILPRVPIESNQVLVSWIKKRVKSNNNIYSF